MPYMAELAVRLRPDLEAEIPRSLAKGNVLTQVGFRREGRLEIEHHRFEDFRLHEDGTESTGGDTEGFSRIFLESLNSLDEVD